MRARGEGADAWGEYDRTMPKPSSDPLDGTDRLLVDGTNLLHALRRGAPSSAAGGRAAGGAGAEAPAPAAALIGRLRGAIPPQVGIELVLDGAPDPGMRNARIASGLIVRHSGRRTGDQLLFDLVDDASRTGGPSSKDRRVAVDNLLVVTDDRQLRQVMSERGVRTAGTAWLIGRLARGRLEAPGTGNRRPPAAPTPDSAPDTDRPGWRPGRGATTKRGNPKRGRDQPR